MLCRLNVGSALWILASGNGKRWAKPLGGDFNKYFTYSTSVVIILCILIIKIYTIHLDLSYIYYYMRKQNFENLIFSGTMLRCGCGYLWLFEWIFYHLGGFREYMLGLTALPCYFSWFFYHFTRNYSIYYPQFLMIIVCS